MRPEIKDVMPPDVDHSELIPEGSNGRSEAGVTTTGGSRAAGRRTIVRAAVYAGLLLVAVGGVYFLTRGSGSSAPMPAGHNHGAAAGGEGAAQPVMLTPEQARRIGVTYAVATIGTLQKEVRTVGQVTFDETRIQAIAPKIDGWIDRLIVNATGQPVIAGQPLLTIYSPMLVTAEEELLLAKRLQGDVSGAAPDAQRNAADLLTSARRRLSYWDIPESEVTEIERTGEVRKTLTLRAPTGGFVLEKNVVAGQKIMAGDALFRVADLSDVWVEGEVFEQDLATVRVGQTVHADFQALPGEHRMGRISYVYPTINPETRTARVRVVLPNADLRLKPGMYATVRIVGTERPAVLTIPSGAVLVTGERNVVFVREANGQLAPREVALGLANDDRVEVLRGLTAGDTVVASATFLVDAESNLGKALGGMGNMPGMDMSAPPTPLPMPGSKAKPSTPAPPGATKPAPVSNQDDMAGMPGMEHSGHPAPAPASTGRAGHPTP